ncbi:(2Fe-2S) ferredoxin domain-containing protein [Desulfovibrio sp. OttesenSCG-928-M16]|nr:(2Fe-2S) ferredoxin domain-containing protein [Desulfovibrio sp. OttesenSCG-928-M16]
MLEINICVGSSCHLKGSYNVIQEVQQIIEDRGLHEQVSIKATFCMKQCQTGVSVGFKDNSYSLQPGKCRDFFDEHVRPLLEETKPTKTKTIKAKSATAKTTKKTEGKKSKKA